MTELVSGDLQRRQMALARLAVIGSRATTALVSVASDNAQGDDARVAAFEALEAIGDGRAISAAINTLTGSNEPVAVAAVGVLGRLARDKDARATRAFDQLASLALSSGAAPVIRLAALTALEGQPERLLKPIYAALAKDPASKVVARVTRRQAGGVESLESLVAMGLPADPEVIAAVARDDGDRTPLMALKRAVDAVRAIEAKTTDTPTRERWTVVRGVLHQQLGARGSRLALYDLREALEGATYRLPVGFLSAAAVVGDTACLTPLARAWVESAHDDRWWRDHLAEAFRAIVAREALPRRHPALRSLLERWPAAGVLVAAARR
ncbi:MAG: hypothetical protein ABIP90_03435 [Vicinamibacterales bacterium]